MNTVEIGNRIKTAREEKGLTQEELGIRLGLNKSTIQRYEAGKILRIKLPVLESIAIELSVNPEYLALKTDDPSPKHSSHIIDSNATTRHSSSTRRVTQNHCRSAVADGAKLLLK